MPRYIDTLTTLDKHLQNKKKLLERMYEIKITRLMINQLRN